MSYVNLYSGTMEMIQYTIETSQFKDYHPEGPYRIGLVMNPNYADLRREIMVFNHEIDWEDMWTFEDAKERLSQGWLFVCLFIDHQIKGWVWLNTKTNTLTNLYVNKDYRNNGYATQLVKQLTKESYTIGVENIKSYVDDWNHSSHSVFNKCNWIKQ